jgi:hypothetical protein
VAPRGNSGVDRARRRWLRRRLVHAAVRGAHRSRTRRGGPPAALLLPRCRCVARPAGDNRLRHIVTDPWTIRGPPALAISLALTGSEDGDLNVLRTREARDNPHGERWRDTHCKSRRRPSVTAGLRPKVGGDAAAVGRTTLRANEEAPLAVRPGRLSGPRLRAGAPAPPGRGARPRPRQRRRGRQARWRSRSRRPRRARCCRRRPDRARRRRCRACPGRRRGYLR